MSYLRFKEAGDIAVSTTKATSSKSPTKKKRTPAPEYQCQCCKKTLTEKEFYTSKSTIMWNVSGQHPLFCRNCIDGNFRDLTDKYGEKNALICTCALLDLPFIMELYTNIITNNNVFSLPMYIQRLNGNQYRKLSFITSIVNSELSKSNDTVEKTKEKRWTKEEAKNKNEVINIIGYDPFEGYPSNNRKYLFSDLIKYCDDDTVDDSYKISQIIQIVNNNNQIRQYDILIATLNPINDSKEIEGLQKLKNSLVASNDKIAKENEISVKNRSNKDIGKSTLTYLMRDLREKDFKAAEANYYNQLRSEGTLWAISMSNKAILQNGMFDENDKREIFENQRTLIQDLQQKLDEELEKNRLLLIENLELKESKGGSK